ncbi:unnamed protein product, partial [Medioppia subpectinata]
MAVSGTEPVVCLKSGSTSLYPDINLWLSFTFFLSLNLYAKRVFVSAFTQFVQFNTSFHIKNMGINKNKADLDDSLDCSPQHDNIHLYGGFT